MIPSSYYGSGADDNNVFGGNKKERMRPNTARSEGTYIWRVSVAFVPSFGSRTEYHSLELIQCNESSVIMVVTIVVITKYEMN